MAEIDTDVASGGSVFSLDEIATHNTEHNLWVIVLGRVYNLTNFLDKHPGGKSILLKSAGKCLALR
jgi:cytochrome b involved in lipid metabolism